MMNDPKPEDMQEPIISDEEAIDLTGAPIDEDDDEERDPLEEIEELRAERDTLKDKLLRALAETENTRRRAAKDRDEATAYGGTRLARDLLGVHDNLDRALKAADDDLRTQAKDFIEGVELTQRELMNAFNKHQIEGVTPEMGEKFNPNFHQAMFEAPVPGAEPGTVIQVMQQGFTISGRLLRPALVGVAKADPNAKPAAAPTEAPDTPSSDETSAPDETH